MTNCQRHVLNLSLRLVFVLLISGYFAIFIYQIMLGFVLQIPTTFLVHVN